MKKSIPVMVSLATLISSMVTVVAADTDNAVATKTTIVVNSPKVNQPFSPNLPLHVSVHLYRTIRQPYIKVALYESSGTNYLSHGKVLSTQHIAEGSDGGFSGLFKVPRFPILKGEHYTLVFRKSIPGAAVVTVPLRVEMTAEVVPFRMVHVYH